MTTTAETFIGIDVSKARLDVAVHASPDLWHAANTAAGIAALVQRVQTLHPTLIVLEATGGYELSLVAELAAAQ